MMSSVALATYGAMSIRSRLLAFISLWASVSFSTKTLLCLLKMSRKSSRILKWKVGVNIFRRPCHLLPVSRGWISNQYITVYFKFTWNLDFRVSSQISTFDFDIDLSTFHNSFLPVAVRSPVLSQGWRYWYSRDLSISLLLPNKAFRKSNKI